ncbi:MAG: hypothetical protein IPO04_10690 [Cytophagaceae bacterium]|nr:hypothetical protein [Cytophagaceae bacterium]
MSFCCAAGIDLCFTEERRKQFAMWADGGKKYASAAPTEKTTKGWRAGEENPAVIIRERFILGITSKSYYHLKSNGSNYII